MNQNYKLQWVDANRLRVIYSNDPVALMTLASALQASVDIMSDIKNIEVWDMRKDQPIRLY